VAEPTRGIDVVGVVGAGTMGAGIAQVALEAGHEVLLHDVDVSAIERGRERIRDGLARRAAKAGLPDDEARARVHAQLTRLRDAHSLDALGAEADLVIEAAIEDLELKRTIFGALDRASGADVILATNTSALSVGEIAAATNTAERVLGLHFFNPAPVMRLVEVVVAPTTAPEVADRASTVVTSWGKTPIRARDVPGFIVNRVNRPFTLEPLRMLEAADAGIVAIDDAIVGAGFPLGPFAYMDLVGIDVNLAAATAIWEGLGRPERLRPSPIQAALVEAGALGRKTGRGFYLYDAGIRRVPAPEFAAGGPTAELPPDAVVRRVREAVAAEAWRAADEGVADRDDIDLALRLGANHPSGPFEWAAADGFDGANRDAAR
jgi:3-hydroxybutyryl-CoA dehydrogenase